MQILRSNLLLDAGFPHGFSTRLGGKSQPPFDSLNLGFGVGDCQKTVCTNFQSFCEHEDLPSIVLAEQRHTDLTREVREYQPGRSPTPIGIADALASTRCAVGVRTADCVPILVASLKTGRVFAIHAGWRGVVSEIVPKAIQAESAESCLVAIGPHIRMEDFEVDADVAEKFSPWPEALFSGSAPPFARADCADFASGRKYRISLQIALEQQLAGLGVREVDVLDGNTFADSHRFFSYRRDGQTGRMLNYIAPRE